MQLQEARDAAIKETSGEYFAQHVNAHLGFSEQLNAYFVTGYSLSDWQDGTTVESYVNGRRI